jgi:hypothetical protein
MVDGSFHPPTHNQGVAGSIPAGPTQNRARVRARASEAANTLVLFSQSSRSLSHFSHCARFTPGFRQKWGVFVVSSVKADQLLDWLKKVISTITIYNDVLRSPVEYHLQPTPFTLKPC